MRSEILTRMLLRNEERLSRQLLHSDEVGKELTNGGLGSRVNKCLDRMPVHFDVDIKHGHMTEGFWLLISAIL